MSRNKIIPYHPKLKSFARELRKNSTLSEVLLWEKIKNEVYGVQFHRQVPILNYIVDFYCHELKLAIEIDGSSHDNKYDYDKKRQEAIEQYDVVFLRFSDIDIKKQMFNVLFNIEQKIEELKTPPLVPLQRGNSSNQTH